MTACARARRSCATSRCAARPRATSHEARAHFIADDPPQAARRRLTHAWLDSRRICPRCTGAASNPRSLGTAARQVQDAGDYIYSSYRALGIPLRDKRRALQAFEALGQRNSHAGSPAGWPDTSADWDGSSALLKRIAWADVVRQRMGDSRNARELGPQVLGGTLGDDTAKAIARAGKRRAGADAAAGIARVSAALNGKESM
jgi:uncharacterized protein (DUF1800 family)